MNGDVDSRMNNLMKVCGCEDRIWSILDHSSNQIGFKKKIDYNLFIREREASKRFVFVELNNPPVTFQSINVFI